MQKNLRWKLLLAGALMAICLYAFISPREKGAPLLSRLNLGLDLKGGIHLVLRVKTDDALNQELGQDAESISQELRSKGAPFDSAKKGNGLSIEISGVDSARAAEVRSHLDATYKARYVVRSATKEGKTDFSLTFIPSYARELRETTVRQALETIRRRVDELGVTEPTLQIYGRSGQDVDDLIIVELPGIDDPERVKGLIENTAQLEFRLVKRENGGPFSTIESAVEANGGTIPEDYVVLPQRENRGEKSEVGYLVVNKVPVITGKDLKTARPSEGDNGRPVVAFFLTSDGAKVFARTTEQHVGERLAIVLDNVVNSAPQIDERIEAEGIIRGSFTQQEVSDLSLLLRSGALPASLQREEERTVGASLGNDSIKSGIYASLLGFGLIVLGMLIYYKLSGINAIVCLLANLIILMGFMGAVGATLTLPGIAGIILTIGMAVDANILIFERIREEMRGGKAVRAAVENGFSKVFWTIFDSNVTTLIAAAFLFQFGTGPIRGFAVTLSVGLIANMITAIFLSHWMFLGVMGNRKVEALSI